MMRSLSSRNARAAASELHSSGGLGIAQPVEANIALKCARSGEPARGTIHGYFLSAGGRDAPARVQRMLGAHDDRERIVEQVFLDDVGRGRRIAQRADQDVRIRRSAAPRAGAHRFPR